MNKPTRYLIPILAVLLCAGCISCTNKEGNPVTLTVTVPARPSLAGPFEFRSVMENKDAADS